MTSETLAFPDALLIARVRAARWNREGYPKLKGMYRAFTTPAPARYGLDAAVPIEPAPARSEKTAGFSLASALEKQGDDEDDDAGGELDSD